MATMLEQLNAEIASLVEDAQRSLVQVRNGRGAGAGTIWHPDGLIITNEHVVGRHPLTVVLADGRALPARVLAQDSARDLAALAVDASDLPTVKLGDSRRLLPGEWVLALGFPWGVRGGLTAGAVIGRGSFPSFDKLRAPRGRMRAGREWIVVGLHLRPGHSGGPLLDAHGSLVGINTMMTGPDIGLAVPVHVVKEFLRETLGSQQVAA